MDIVCSGGSAHHIFGFTILHHSSNMGIWVFEHAQQTGLTCMLWKCHIAGLQCSLQIVSDTLNLNMLNANNVLGVWGQMMRPSTPPADAVRCWCDQFAIMGNISKLCGCEPEGTICLVFSRADLDPCECFCPLVFGCALSLQNSPFFCVAKTLPLLLFLSPVFLLLFLIVYPFFPSSSLILSPFPFNTGNQHKLDAVLDPLDGNWDAGTQSKNTFHACCPSHHVCVRVWCLYSHF